MYVPCLTSIVVGDCNEDSSSPSLKTRQVRGINRCLIELKVKDEPLAIFKQIILLYRYGYVIVGGDRFFTG